MVFVFFMLPWTSLDKTYKSSSQNFKRDVLKTQSISNKESSLENVREIIVTKRQKYKHANSFAKKRSKNHVACYIRW